ncbi:MAG: hypothetical protein KatS3mg059_0835 [Thermomicrobiales bacterium]|nr:MAG: hypothetical protein KatS3mg059_0835 [Thermomicrobiales bacterium]
MTGSRMSGKGLHTRDQRRFPRSRASTFASEMDTAEMVDLPAGRAARREHVANTRGGAVGTSSIGMRQASRSTLPGIFHEKGGPA